MKETNAKKMERFERELGRLQKKIEDEAREKAELQGWLADARAGNKEMQMLVDALITAIALQYGEDAYDPDEPGKLLGKRLRLARFDCEEVRKKYELRARRDMEADGYVIGVMERAEAE